MAKKPERVERPLRVAFLFNGSILDEAELLAPKPVVLGEAPEASFPIPDGYIADPSITLLAPEGSTYRLRLTRGLSGSVWIAGTRREVADLALTQSELHLGVEDYGVVFVGPLAVFFQHVRAAKEPQRRFFAWDGAIAASIGLVALLFSTALVLSFLELRERPPTDPFELRPDLVTRFVAIPPPEEIVEKGPESGTETPDPGLRSREETGGKRHEGEEGRVGKKDATREDTQIAGEVTDAVSAKVRGMGLLGALTGGGEGNTIAQALDVPNVSDLLGGMGAVQTVIGRGSGGTGLRGVGTGGGGDGPGSLFGAGNIGTGIGAGKGSGTGKGSGGIGVPGAKRKEAQISVGQGTPKVSGYLSPEQINRVVRANQAAIRYCYEVEVQRQPNLKGKIELEWTIGLAGEVKTSRVGSTSMNNAKVEGCLVRQVKRWRFPQPDGGEVRVSYPFLFGVQ